MNNKIPTIAISLLFIAPFSHLISCNSIEGNVKQDINNLTTDTTTYSLPTPNPDRQPDNNANQDSVLICNSKNARTYHNKISCSGLKRCKAEIVYANWEHLENSGYRACKVCH